MKNTQEFVHGKRCYELELPWMDEGAIIWLNNLKNKFKCYEYLVKATPNIEKPSLMMGKLHYSNFF